MHTYANDLITQRGAARLGGRNPVRWRIGRDHLYAMFWDRAYAEVFAPARGGPRALLGLPYRIDHQEPLAFELEG